MTYYMVKALSYDPATRSATQYLGSPRTTRALALLDAVRWINSMMAWQYAVDRSGTSAKRRGEILAAMKTSPEEAVRVFNDHNAPMSAWIEINRGRVSSAKTGTRLKAYGKVERR